MMSTKPKFKAGDLVQHKASGERAVVVRPIEACVVHKFPVMCWLQPWVCRIEFTDRYLVKIGFVRQVVCAEDELREIKRESK